MQIHFELDKNIVVLLPLMAIQLVLAIIALVDLAKRDTIRGPKLLWVLIIVLVNLFGPIAYFVFGRKSEG
jgi:hypothetical protein